MVIIIEGTIGVGKSRLLRQLQQHQFIRTFPEPVDKWENFNEINLLKDFYESSESDYSNNLFKLQIFILSTLLEREHLINETISDPNSPPLLIVERSIQSSLAFMDNDNFNSLEKEIARFLCKQIQTISNIPFLSIFLTAPLPIIHKRLLERNRKSEKNIDKNYLKKIEETLLKLSSFDATLYSDEKIENKMLFFLYEKIMLEKETIL